MITKAYTSRATPDRAGLLLVSRPGPILVSGAAVGGRLVRMQRGPGFSPADLVDAVRTFNEQTLNDAMDRAVDAGRALLAPWV